jgi:plasmid stabilization system protein ParE
MKFASVTLPRAESDLNEITSYLNCQRENLGLEFLYKYKDTVASLRKYPKGFRLAKKGFREIQVGKFKYLVIYKVHSNKVWIHRLIHAARKPSKRYRVSE